MRFGMGVQTDSCAQASGELRDLEPLLDPHFRWRSLKDGLEFSGGARRKRGETHLIKVIARRFLQSRCRIVASLLPLSPVFQARRWGQHHAWSHPPLDRILVLFRPQPSPLNPKPMRRQPEPPLPKPLSLKPRFFGEEQSWISFWLPDRPGVPD